MTLFEFLASPGEYSGMKKVKTAIASHVARDKADYHRICERFHELSGKKEAGSGRELGIRTRIVHQGEHLEDILPDEAARKELFREMQRYASRVLIDMLERTGLSWETFLEYRVQRRTRLGIGQPSPEE
jgi:hypothetical protein